MCSPPDLTKLSSGTWPRRLVPSW